MLPHSGPTFELDQNATLLVEFEKLSMFRDCPLEVKKIPKVDNYRIRRSGSEFDFSKFNTFDQISIFLESLEETEIIGSTHEKRNIYNVKLGNSRPVTRFTMSHNE